MIQQKRIQKKSPSQNYFCLQVHNRTGADKD